MLALRLTPPPPMGRKSRTILPTAASLSLSHPGYMSAPGVGARGALNGLRTSGAGVCARIFRRKKNLAFASSFLASYTSEIYSHYFVFLLQSNLLN